MEKDDKFSRREWFFVIALLMMLEYWLISISYEFTDDQDLINFVSFGATIASLLLAVVAIIYGFFQSDASSKSSAIIREQANGLKTSTVELSSSVLIIERHLEKIAVVTDRLDVLDLNIRGSVDKINTLEVKVQDFHIAQDEALRSFLAKAPAANQVEVNHVGGFTSEWIFEFLLRKTSYSFDLMGYALNKYVENGDSLSVTDFCAKYYALPAAGSSGSGVRLVFNIFPLLKAAGGLSFTFSGEPVVVEEPLKKLLPNFARLTKEEAGEHTADMIKVIDNIV